MAESEEARWKTKKQNALKDQKTALDAQHEQELAAALVAAQQAADLQMAGQKSEHEMAISKMEDAHEKDIVQLEKTHEANLEAEHADSEATLEARQQMINTLQQQLQQEQAGRVQDNQTHAVAMTGLQNNMQNNHTGVLAAANATIAQRTAYGALMVGDNIRLINEREALREQRRKLQRLCSYHRVRNRAQSTSVGTLNTQLQAAHAQVAAAQAQVALVQAQMVQNNGAQVHNNGAQG